MTYYATGEHSTLPLLPRILYVYKVQLRDRGAESIIKAERQNLSRKLFTDY